MRKFLALIVGLCLIFCFIGCNNKEKVDVEISTGVADENYGIEVGIVKKIDFHNTVGTVSYTSHESTTTKYGTDIIVIYFTFTNNTYDYLSLHDVANFRAYQDGIEIEGCQLDTETGDNSWKEIAKDKSLDCAIAFKTTSKDVVHLRVSPIIDGCFDSSVYQEQELFCSNQHSENDENRKIYKFSDYINEKYLKDELLYWFAEYNIHYYDESLVRKFSDMNLPKPETAIADYPSYTKENDSYIYTFDKEEECRVYLSAYMVYLMNLDYEVTDIGDNVYSISNEYYIGLGKVDEKYCFIIVEL
ncbi:MAG: DUF5067 domain-containing protein [Clostridia bacterium]|nr:DUF5067 domain-containing protein [Clostridia bacterium]